MMDTMRRHLWWIGGLVLLVGGVVLFLSTPPQTDFGWFAYAPQHPRMTDYVTRCAAPCVGLSFGQGDEWLISTGQVVGATLALLGLILLAGGTGFTLGRRRRQA